MGELFTGYPIFHWVATWSNPVLDVFFRVVTDLGYPLFYYLLIAPLFWIIDRRRSMVLFLLLLLSALLNAEAKLFFDTPRPDPAVVRVLDMRPIQSGSRSFPSGHAQIAVVFWGYLAYWVGRRWFTGVALFLIAAIAFSRVYLGAHFPIDVAGGLIIGAATMAIVPWLERWSRAAFAMRPVFRLAAGALAFGLMLQTGDAALVTIAGCVMAFLALQSLPPAPVVLAWHGRAVLIVLAGLALQIGAAALLGQLAPGPQVTAGTGLRVMTLWLVALWAYPHAVAAVVNRGGRAVGDLSP